MLVFHYTGLPSLKESLHWLTTPEKKISSHYLIGEEGEIFHLVPERKRAWHAGVSYWGGATDINSCSIGIEVQNPGHEHGYQPFPERQINSLILICRKIMERYDIPANRVLGHSDVAPGRKKDPGELFPWRKLAEGEVGVWPYVIGVTQPGDDKELRAMFSKMGYNPECPLEDVITAFQRHWQPGKVDGVADAETWELIRGLL